MECCRRPNRSDVHVAVEEEAEMEAKTKQYFDGFAPKRHTKPHRSDYSSQYVDALAGDTDGIIPEMLQFERLENFPQSQADGFFKGCSYNPEIHQAVIYCPSSRAGNMG